MKLLSIFFVILFCSLPSSANPIRNLEWKDIDRLSLKAAELCKEKSKDWKGILVVSRGGLVPGGILAQSLNIKNVRVICLASYTKEKTKGEIREIYKPTDINEEGAGWIVVDDLVDSGKTLEYIRKIYPKAFYITLIAKPDGKKHVDACAEDSDQQAWIVFPWEEKTPEKAAN